MSIAPYGIVFPISRQMLVNDDLAAIEQILSGAADAVYVFENNTFFAMFNSNPTPTQDNNSDAILPSGTLSVWVFAFLEMPTGYR